MQAVNRNIDAGRPFDWDRTSADYAQYRDIYPPVFYQKIIERGLCVTGQDVLDVGTGTGVLPRNLYRFGACWTGTDRSETQIEQAKRLSREAEMDIAWQTAATEDLSFPDGSFDVITACQCFWYFDHEKTSPLLSRILKADGRLLLLYLAWLPQEDAIAANSEVLVLRFNPTWSGAHEVRHPISVPPPVLRAFEVEDHEEFDVRIPFTRESWHGRMRACRGTGASLPPKMLSKWEEAHKAMLLQTAPERFEVLHYAALTVLKKRAAHERKKHLHSGRICGKINRQLNHERKTQFEKLCAE